MVLNANVTRHAISLGSRDPTTGCRNIAYTESTIECFEFSKGAHFSFQGVGVYAAEDKMFLTADPADVYDRLEPRTGEYYLIQTVKEHNQPTPDNFLMRELQCSALPLWQAPPSSATWKTSPNDPRERMKVWIDTYIRNAQITKNDGSTQASWACMFANPPYPLVLEFRGTSNIHGFYTVHQPNSTAQRSADQIIRRYHESVPIHIWTVDSTDVDGEALAWKMHAELRYISQTYSTGSQRNLTTMKGEHVMLGSDRLYHIETILDYERGTT